MKTSSSTICRAFLLFVFASVALLPHAEAVVPAPDGGYPGGNTAEGQSALLNLNTAVGTNNTAVGYLSLKSNVTGGYNTAIGSAALLSNTADVNTAVGSATLFKNTTGAQNTATGALALLNNITGSDNTANGAWALFRNTNGYQNTAYGVDALFSNINGFYNTANGWSALYSNTSGNANTAIGIAALYGNTIGHDNTANGNVALYSNTSGFYNTAVGEGALRFLVSGGNNTAIGSSAGSALTGSESGNIYIGSGAVGVAGESGVIRIGGTSSGDTACYVGTDSQGGLGSQIVYIGGELSTIYAPSILNFVGTNFADVGINSGGALVPFTSSARFKENIKPMDKVSESIFALKPVTFRYKKEVDATEASQFGLIAEEVAKVNPSLVALDADGKPFSVNYRPVTAMLLNEFLKEHRTVQAQQKEIEALRAELKEQKALIQKVNDKVELNRAAPQTVANDQ